MHMLGPSNQGLSLREVVHERCGESLNLLEHHSLTLRLELGPPSSLPGEILTATSCLPSAASR